MTKARPWNVRRATVRLTVSGQPQPRVERSSWDALDSRSVSVSGGAEVPLAVIRNGVL